MPDLAEGAVFAGHRIEGVAGRGGMGTVYRATHLALDHLVALKVISADLADDESFRMRFKSESRIAVSLRHPNVVPIHHAGEEEGLLFVTMDLIDGPDLRRLLAARGPLPPAEAVAILEQIGAALDVAHSRGLVHRDIKPGNILIEQRDGEGPGGEHAYLTDFGLTKRIEGASEATALTSTGAFVGTLDYVAPEQIQGGRLDARTDVYALGCVLFEMLAGHPPFEGREEKVAKMYAHLQAEPPWLPGARLETEPFDAVIARAMAKDPEQRFPSAGDLARAAAAAAEGEAVRESERSVARGRAAPTETAATPVPPVPTQPGVPDFRSTAEADAPSEHLVAPAADPATTRTSVPPPEPGPRRSRPVRPLSLLVALVSVVLLGFVVVSVLGGDEGGGDPESSETADAGTSGPGAGASEPEAGEEVPVDGQAVGVAADGDGVFAVSRDTGVMTPIDPATKETGTPVELGGGGEEVAIDEGSGSVWVTEPNSGEVTVSPAGGGEAVPIALGEEPRGILAADGAIFVTDLAGGTVSRLDPAQGPAAIPEVIVDGLTEPHGLAFADGELWISERGANRVTRFELASGTSESFEVGANPKGVAVDDGIVWVANTDEGTVSRLDAASGDPRGKRIEVGGQPRAIEIGLGGVWVSNGGEVPSGDEEPDGYVSLLDAAGGEVSAEVEVAGSPEGLALGDGRVWVTTGTGESIVPIAPG
jgi:serine/threonine protein kinase/DNA-binding beta-propeller fold protein YncE